jgi:hypothetical protein
MIFSIAFFALCGVALVVATLSARRDDPAATLSELFDRMMADRTARIAVLVIWWWLGWHFLAGQTVDTP